MTKSNSTKIKTWGEALDYTWNVKWKRLNSAKTCQINSNHITSYAGRSFPLRRMAVAGWWLQLMADLQDEGRNTSTINRIVSAGTTAVGFSGRAGLHEIVVPKFDRLKEGESRLTWFTKDDVDKLAHISRDLFGHVWGEDLADAILVSAYLGCRQGELLKLKADDYDAHNNQIWIGGKPGRVTKSKNVRNISLHPRIEPIIINRLDSRDRLFGDDWNNKDQLYSAFKKVRKVAGFDEDYVWHTFRHSFGTWLGEKTHPRQIMELLGHSTIDMALKYAKATDEATKAAVLSL